MNKLIASLVTFALVFVSMNAIANPTRGYTRDSDLLRPTQTVTYRVMLEPGEITRFTIQGDGDGDIDCVLYDDSGNVAATDTDSTDTCLIDWTPAWRAVFTFRAVNNGSLSSYYTFKAY